MLSRQRQHQLRYPERDKARVAVARAKKAGRLPKASDLLCVDCGRQAQEYDHYLGYNEEHWLDVQPVCKPCHERRGKNPRFDAKVVVVVQRFCRRCGEELPSHRWVYCSTKCRQSDVYTRYPTMRAAAMHRYWLKNRTSNRPYKPRLAKRKHLSLAV